MSEANEADRQRAYDSFFGYRSLDDSLIDQDAREPFAQHFAAHRLAAAKAERERIVQMLRERAADLRFRGFDLDSITIDELADKIETNQL